VTTTAAGGLSTADLARHLGVSYRQLDYLARTTIDGGDLAGARGQGSRRVWRDDLVARLAVATVIAGVTGRRWGEVARAVVDGPEPPPDGWVVVDDLGSVFYAADERAVVAVLARGNGGTCSRYALPPAA
jgi:hypothetical protein